jgi:hypothetical protein
MKNQRGLELTQAEQEIADCYRKLVEILKKEDLEPFERRNTLKAVAALWQVMNGLDLDPGQIYDIGA